MMDDLKNNKIFWILVAVTVLNVGGFLVGRVLIDKAADRVIQKLQREYSPSPYGPGFDPDKVNPDGMKSTKKFFEVRQVRGLESSTQEPEVVTQREEFERERGFSPER